MTSAITEPSMCYLPPRVHELRPLIDAALRECTELPDGCPAQLRQAIRYSLLAPGKRFRPLLTLLAAEACGSPIQPAMAAACAVEMVHAYSLIHDDLPAMDNDDFRRSRPTCHRQFGEAVAILAGDALLTLAFEVLSRQVRPVEVAGECCAVLAEAAGACNLVGGQADDMLPDPAEWTLEKLESIHRRKTGALILASLRLGAAAVQASHLQRAALDEYGVRLGLAFQITDDLLDLSEDAQPGGSPAHGGTAMEKLTFPALLGVEESAARAEQLVCEACQALETLGPRADCLQALARYTFHRTQGILGASVTSLDRA